ncbi:pilin assembly protein [Alkalimarinus sediminis]|uniref:Pilin assembly protein n=1 Tax=Alkalimarinus sediminis TaxID=1632866 RepID=A0A9E8HJ06_9ALTE|nr:pilin assembly protein [Alkalimarinus sediminis]UZW75555.1 pilin assembly protein [Alkalimarinus sediminis]
MKISTLAKHWEDNAKARLTSKEYTLRLPIEDAARIAALSEMYPKRTEEELISELLSAALDELETSFPYKKGHNIIAEDELGDPLYEDIGPTPRFLDLSKKFMAMLKQNKKAANS